MRAKAGLAAALVLCVFALAPLGYPGYFQPQSGFTPIYNLYAWERAGLRLGPGSPSGPGLLPYALAEVARFAGMDGAGAAKLVFALSILVAAAGAYLLFLEAGQPASALSLALVWVYSPLSVAAVFVRGSLTAAPALALLPWLAWALSRRAAAAPAAVIALAIGLCSPGFALLAFLATAAGTFTAGRPRWRSYAGAALGLAASWAGLLAMPQGAVATPAFYQLAYPYQLLAYNWGYGASSLPWSATPPAPMTLGTLIVALGLVATLAPLASAAQQSSGRSDTLASGMQDRAPACWPTVIVVALLIAAATPLAGPLWTRRSLGLLLEGPWQLLALASFLILWQAGPRLAVWLGSKLEYAGALAVLALAMAVPSLEVPTTAVQPATAPLASFAGGQVLLVRAELDGPLRHGASPRLRLYWQSTRPLERDYTVFVQVLDQSDHKWAQQDVQPAEGKRPTSGWRPGELVVDDHVITIDPDGPRQGYRLIMGLYDSLTQQPVPLDDGRPYLELTGG